MTPRDHRSVPSPPCDGVQPGPVLPAVGAREVVDQLTGHRGCGLVLGPPVAGSNVQCRERAGVVDREDGPAGDRWRGRHPVHRLVCPDEFARRGVHRVHATGVVEPATGDDHEAVAHGGLLEGYWNGQTVGKRLLGIEVVDGHGEAPSVGQAFARNLPAVVLFSWLTSAVALAAMAATDRRQRVFDVAPGTVDVRTRAAAERPTAGEDRSGSLPRR